MIGYKGTSISQNGISQQTIDTAFPSTIWLIRSIQSNSMPLELIN